MSVQMKLEAALMALITDWPDLLNTEAAGGSVKGGAETNRLPGGTGAISLVAEGHAIITSWCMAVIDGRDLTGATVGTDTEDRADFLLTHAAWLASEAPDAEEELSDLSGRVRALVAPSGVRRVPIGACPALDCGGAVFAAFDGKQQWPDLTCDLDTEHSWPEPHYRRLASLLGCDGPDRMSVDDFITHVAEKFGREVNRATVRVWIHRHPDELKWDRAEQTLDRLKAVSFWLERRAARAGAA